MKWFRTPRHRPLRREEALAHMIAREGDDPLPPHTLNPRTHRPPSAWDDKPRSAAHEKSWKRRSRSRHQWKEVE